MPANVETAVYSNTPAWHREGTVLDSSGMLGLDVQTALKESGLDWTVEKVPVFAYSDYERDPDGRPFPEPTLDSTTVQITDRFGVQRDSDKRILGVVGKSWEPVQNVEGFQVITEFMQGGTAYIEAAGSLDGGKKVWILAHMAEDMQIAGEDIARYVLFTNGHDGRSSVAAAMTDIRVVCANTLDLATMTAERIVRVRHTTKATEKLAEAKRILGIRDLYSEELAKQGEWLVNQEMSDKQFDTFLTNLMPIEEEQLGTPAATMIANRQAKVRHVYKSADNLNNIRGTRWGALNAVIEFSDHGREFKTPESQMKAQWGITNGALKHQAQTLLTATAPKGVKAPA